MAALHNHELALGAISELLGYIGNALEIGHRPALTHFLPIQSWGGSDYWAAPSKNATFFSIS